MAGVVGGGAWCRNPRLSSVGSMQANSRGGGAIPKHPQTCKRTGRKNLNVIFEDLRNRGEIENAETGLHDHHR